MKAKKRLSELLKTHTPAKAITLNSIKDYAKFEDIYENYLTKRWFTMCNQIREYGEFEFFRDILVFCRHRYKSEQYRHDIYWHLYELYFIEITI